MSLAPDGYPDGGYAYVTKLEAEIERLRKLATFAALQLEDSWVGEWPDGAGFDWAVECGLIMQPKDPCGPEDNCEWCEPEPDGERCWQYAPGIHEQVLALVEARAALGVR